MSASSPLTLHAAPGAGFEQPFEMLAACHERVERMLRLTERLAAHLVQAGADEQARQAARDVMRYFDIAGPAHHEDEERHVLPALRGSGDAALRALADALAADHREMARQWPLLRAALAAVAEGQWQAAGEEPLPGAAAFAALYRRHIADEDTRAYPPVRDAAAPAALAAMGDEMARRRGVR
jgi:hemerythrin-like domain-containing protein